MRVTSWDFGSAGLELGYLQLLYHIIQYTTYPLNRFLSVVKAIYSLDYSIV